jgi:3-oxoacyl-[acyl-carrier-protein] synthase II
MPTCGGGGGLRVARKCGSCWSSRALHDFHGLDSMRWATSFRRRRRRVVVTGLGAVTPLGGTFCDTWRAILQEQCGITSLEQALKYQGLEHNVDVGCQVAAAIPPEYLTESKKNTARFVQLALQSGREAIQSARLFDYLGLEPNSNGPIAAARREMAGVCLGVGMSSVRQVTEAMAVFQTQGPRRISPHFVPSVLGNSAAGRLSLEFSLQGPNHTVTSACAASSHAIGDAARLIQYGDANIMLAGGSEACIDPLSLTGFSRLRALSSSVVPREASRPFDVHRSGFVMAEGAAVLVLEDYEHARARGAPILAELVGYGTTGDAHHITSPDPHGRGAVRAMERAIQDAAVAATDSRGDYLLQSSIDRVRDSVAYVNAHATSTPVGDEIEARAIAQVFGTPSTTSDTRPPPLYVSSTKGATGHLLGAAGAIEAAFVVQSLVDQVIPATLNLTPGHAILEQESLSLDEQRPLDFVRATTIPTGKIRSALSNSFGFGGTNASLLFLLPQSESQAAK